MGFKRIPAIPVKSKTFTRSLLARLTRLNDLREPGELAEKSRDLMAKIDKHIKPCFRRCTGADMYRQILLQCRGRQDAGSG